VPRVSGRGTFAVARSRFAVTLRAPCWYRVSLTRRSRHAGPGAVRVERDETWRLCTQCRCRVDRDFPVSSQIPTRVCSLVFRDSSSSRMRIHDRGSREDATDRPPGAAMCSPQFENLRIAL
jgi:hypothetical protein